MKTMSKAIQGVSSNGLADKAPRQENAEAALLTGGLRVLGRVKAPFVLSFEELSAMETEGAKDIAVNCGEGDPVGRIESCRGVLLENVIGRAPVLKEDHNDTKKMFIVASATDGYKAVFSWQEIFNTEIGGGVMVLIERDGKWLCGNAGGLELISLHDYFSGPRYVKGLETLEVLMVG